jgi:hypothetical protein
VESLERVISMIDETWPAIDALVFAHGLPPDGDPHGGLHGLLREAPEDVRGAVLQGLRALSEWQEQHQGRR